MSDKVVFHSVIICCLLCFCQASRTKQFHQTTASFLFFYAADLFGYGSCFGRVKIFRQHRVPKEEHVLQHALTDLEEARRTRYPKGETYGGALAIGMDPVLLFREIRPQVEKKSTVAAREATHSANRAVCASPPIQGHVAYEISRTPNPRRK